MIEPSNIVVLYTTEKFPTLTSCLSPGTTLTHVGTDDLHSICPKKAEPASAGCGPTRCQDTRLEIRIYR